MQESAAASLELLGPTLGDQRRGEPHPPSGPPPQFSKPRPPLEPPPMSRPPGLIEFRPPNSNTPLLCTVIANTKTEKKKSKKVSTTASKTASKDKGAVMVSIEKPLTPENHNKLKQSTPSAAETEEANLNAELEKIRWKRELARLKRENESLKQRISQKEEIELEEDVVNIPPRPPAGPPPQLVTSNGTDNSSNELSGTASSIWSMLKSAVDATLGLSARTTPLPLSGTSMVITEPTEPLPPQMIQTRRNEAIVGGALSRSSNGTNGVPLSEVPLTPIPMLLNGRNTVWRMPFNGKGSAEKRVLTVALHADTQPSNAPILDACFLDLDKMISTPHSSHKQHAVQLKLPLSLQWYELAPNKAGTRRELVIPSGASVMTGHATAAFQKKILKGESLPRADLCFSLVVPTRTLDLAVETAHEAQAWVASLQYLVRLADSLSRKEEVPNEFPDSRPSVIASIPATLQHLLQANSAIGITGEPIPVNSSHSSSRASAEARHAISMQLGHPGYTSQPTPTPDVLGTSHASDSPPRSPLAAGASPKSSGTIFNGSGKQSGTVGMAALNRVVEGPLQMRGTWKDRLFSAARNGDIDVFEAVLAGGAPVDTPIGTDMNTLASQSSGSLGLGGNHKWDTPLIVAARQGCINIITVCLKAGAKNDPFGQGTTALHAAVGARQYEAATVLLQSAALAGAASTICEILDSSGNSPLHLAAGLLSGADAAVGGSDDGLRLIELLIGYGASLKQRDAQGRTCLHLAAAAVHAAAIELMLEYDDELINLVDNAGNAALHIVVIKNDIACARVLLQSAANPYLKSAQYGKNALNLAISKGFTNLGVLLLEYKTYVDDNGNTEFVDPDNMSRVGSIKQVASQSYHIADPTTSVEEEPHVEATYDVPAAEFFVREQHWRMYMWREEGSADAPYFVDANGDSTWDDPRDFVEMADENISAQVVREEPTEPSSQAENELQPELPTMLPVMSSAPINDRTNYSGPDVVTWIYGEPDEVVPVYAQYPAQSSIDGPPEFYLRKRRLSDAEAYFAAIDASREHLNRTIPSRAVPETLLAAQEMIASSLDQWVKRTAFQYFIWEPVLDAEVIASSGLLRGQEQLVGSIALFNRNSPNTLEVGFWVSASHCRRGLASRATLALMLMAFETFSKPQRGLSNYEPPVMRTTQDSDLQMIELYHDKLLERQSGGVARKIGFLREEEKEYEPAVTKAPTSGLMVRWAYPVDRLTRLKMLKIGSKVKN